MQFLDFDISVIKCICDWLDVKNLVVFASSCSSLRSFYPSIKVKYKSIYNRVLDDIRAIDYKIIDYEDPDEWSDTSERVSGDAVVCYTHEHKQRSLYISYTFPNTDKSMIIYDGGYPDSYKYRKFSTFKDRLLWKPSFYLGRFGHLQRLRLPDTVEIMIFIEETGYQYIQIRDGMMRNHSEVSNYPPWVDKNR